MYFSSEYFLSTSVYICYEFSLLISGMARVVYFCKLAYLGQCRGEQWRGGPGDPVPRVGNHLFGEKRGEGEAKGDLSTVAWPIALV